MSIVRKLIGSHHSCTCEVAMATTLDVHTYKNPFIVLHLKVHVDVLHNGAQRFV
jgi:hypothetical protein